MKKLVSRMLILAVVLGLASFAIADVSPDGDDLTGGFPAGIPGLCGATCAATGKLAANDKAAIPANTWTMRFQFTNPSSSCNLAAIRPPQ